MNTYTELTLSPLDPVQAEILTAELAALPFESFATEADALKAYIPARALDACRQEVDALLRRYGLAGRYAEIPSQDWNALWEEEEFTPVAVDRRLLIRAPHHAPAGAGVMEAVIRPRMSFGTGHHVTTRLMARTLLDLGVAGRRGLDMGSGTGVLAIVAAKCGAAPVDAVDIDAGADANCRENIAANGVADRIEPLLGDIGRVAGRRYDFILANICRNVLAAHMPAYAAALAAGGDLLTSGFLVHDAAHVEAAAAAEGLHRVALHTDGEWALLHLRKA